MSDINTGDQLCQIWSESKSWYHTVLTWFERWTWSARRVQFLTFSGRKSFWWCLHPAIGTTHKLTSSNTHEVHVMNLQSHTCLKDLWSRFIISFGVLDQQVNVFSHGVDTGVVANLKQTHWWSSENPTQNTELEKRYTPESFVRWFLDQSAPWWWRNNLDIAEKDDQRDKGRHL